MLNKLLFAAAALAVAAPASGALAQEWGYWGEHARDHAEHGAFHDEADEAHAWAHERGFSSWGEHEAYHRALRDMHDEFHDEHPGTRHDGYRLPSRRGYGYYGGYGYGGYSGYEYVPYGYSYGWGRGW
jgi:hypothetical protein